MPIRPEILALKIAAGTLPWAIDTITTDEETVEGIAAKNKNDSQYMFEAPSATKGKANSTIIGNSKNVDNCTKRCSFQFFSPVLILWGLNFNP